MKIDVTNLIASEINEKYFQKIGKVVLEKLKLPKNSEVSLVFAGDKEIRQLNKEYRGIDKATDVLSFAYEDVKIPPNLPLQKGGICFPPFLKEGQSGFLGEIIICVPWAKRQAQEQSYPLERELTILFVHGILHLVGYDDQTQDGYEEMMRKQKELLRDLGF